MHLLCRRNFLKAGITFSIGPLMGCRLSGDPALTVSDLGIQVPRLLFFPECRGYEKDHCGVKPVILEQFIFSDAGSVVSVQFSNGKTLGFDAGASFLTSVKPIREKVALKSLAAWVIAGASKIARSVPRKYFDALQEQPVLEAVTPISIYLLLKKLKGRKNTNRITWNASRSSFEAR